MFGLNRLARGLRSANPAMAAAGLAIAVLADGRVVASGPPAEVLDRSLIATHFKADVRIIDDIDGPVIVPTVHRSSRENP